MKTARSASLLLVTLLAAGCVSTQPEVYTRYHPADGLRTDLTKDNQLDSGESDRDLLWLNAFRVFSNYREAVYYLEVLYAARVETGYLDIGPGPNLVITADGKEMKFAGNGSQHMRKSKGGVLNERALYVAQAADLRTIGSAQKVSVRVIGRNGMAVRDFNAANRERFRQFAVKFASGK